MKRPKLTLARKARNVAENMVHATSAIAFLIAMFAVMFIAGFSFVIVLVSKKIGEMIAHGLRNLKHKKGSQQGITQSVIMVAALALLVLVVLSLIFIQTPVFDTNSNDNRSVDFSYHWACMDGCFNMLIVNYGYVDFNNASLEAKHGNCTSMCFDMYLSPQLNASSSPQHTS